MLVCGVVGTFCKAKFQETHWVIMLIYVHFRNFVLLWFDHDILLSPNVLVTRTELRGGYERGLPLLGVGVSVTSTYLSTFSSFLYAVYIARIFEDNNFHCFQNYSFKNKFLKLIVLYTVLCIQSSRSLKLNLQNWLWRPWIFFLKLPVVVTVGIKAW